MVTESGNISLADTVGVTLVPPGPRLPEETPDEFATRVISQTQSFVVGVIGHMPEGPTVVDE